MTRLPNFKSALVVEDDYLVAIDLRETLLALGCETVTMAGAASEAQRIIDRGGIDFVTLDLRLLDGDGFGFAEQLRDSKIPFVYLTGYEATDYPEAPNAPWVEKPFDTARLRQALVSTGSSDFRRGVKIKWRPAACLGVAAGRPIT